MTHEKELEFGVVIAQQWRDWQTIRKQAEWAERVGWDHFYVFDHFYSLRPTHDGPTHEGWSLLAALAVCTSKVKLGTMVTGMTHRFPSVFFKQAVTIDHISDGRLLLGVGASWNEPEHTTYGIPFPPPADRVDLFTEAMEVYRRFETQETVTFEGKQLRVVDAPLEPKPVNGHIPVLMGTSGKRMLKRVARFADYWEPGRSAADVPGLWSQIEKHCDEIGRDPAEIRLAVSSYCEKSSNERAPRVDWDADWPETERRVRDHVAAYYEVGVRTFYFNIPTDAPNDVLEQAATELLPKLREEYRG